MFGRGAFFIPRVNPPIPFGEKLMFLGDSQTDGRMTAGTPTKSPIHALTNILERSLSPGNLVNPYALLDTSTVYRSGRSGESLPETMTHYNSVALGTRQDRTLVHFQESGNQNQTGQTTAFEFGDAVDDMLDTVLALTPNAIILTETAFNFDRGDPHTAGEGQGGYTNESFRDWTAYNVELRSRFAARGKPNQLFIAETDQLIKDYQAIIGKANVWFSVWNETNFAHYKAPGNLMVALGYLKALRYQIRSLNLSGIPTSEVSQAHRDIALSLVA